MPLVHGSIRYKHHASHWKAFYTNLKYKQGFPPRLKFTRLAGHLSLLYMLLAMFITAIYCGSVVQRLVMPPEIPQIETLEDLLSSGRRVVVFKGTYTADMFKSTSASDLGRRFEGRLDLVEDTAETLSTLVDKLLGICHLTSADFTGN